jgi:hypothetical protein
MTITGSGAISMSDIRTELGDSGAISLKEASDGTIATINTANDAANRPDGSAPHAMSEFYSYDHSATSAVWGTLNNFSMAAGDGATVTSNQQITLIGGSGDTVVTCPTGFFGVLTVAVSTSSTPSSDHAASKTIAMSGNQTLYMQFKMVGAERAGNSGTSARNVTLVNSGVTKTVVVTCITTGD